MTTDNVWPEERDLSEVFDGPEEGGCTCPRRIRVVSTKAEAEKIRAGYCHLCGGLLPVGPEATLTIVVVTDPDDVDPSEFEPREQPRRRVR